MKYLQLIIALFFSSHIILQAQEFAGEFGKLSKEDLELTKYQKDPNAEAVVLFDIGKSSFYRSDNSFQVLFERTTRIKIFSEAGLKWAQIEIPYYYEGNIFENVHDIEAYTYNFENGQLSKTKLNTTEAFDEKVTDYYKVKKFALPDVKEGSIIEYKYKVSSPYKFNLQDWNFQWKIPVTYSEYEVKMIPFYEYTYLLQGASKFDFHASYLEKGMKRKFGVFEYQDMVHKFVMKDLPSFKDEEFITSINDYIIKLDFQLSKIINDDASYIDIKTSWPDLIKDLTKHDSFGKYIKKSEKLAGKILDEDALSSMSPMEKFDFILNYVKGNFNWNEIYGKYATKSPNDFVKDNYGSCADINLFTIGLLRSCGIVATPVLISTRPHGKIKYDYPYSHFFNYVIIFAYIDGKTILSDATEILIANDRIPSRCINEKGLIINNDKVAWINLKSNSVTKSHKNFNINLSDNEMLTDIKIKANEYQAFNYRNYYGKNKEKIIEKITLDGYQVIDSSIVIKNQLNIKEPYILEYQTKNELEKINNKIYISPFLNETITDNPLKQNKRTYPIDIVYQKRYIFNSTINIPEGYKIDFISDDYKFNNDLIEFNYVSIVENEKINISFNYFFKKSVYSVKDYSRIKFYFKEIVKKGNDKVVLIKEE
jgi:transglutaminase-like putative cysteine protease